APFAPATSPSVIVSAPVADSATGLLASNSPSTTACSVGGAARSTGALAGSCCGMAGGAGAVFASGWTAGAVELSREQPAASRTDTASIDSATRRLELAECMDLDPRTRRSTARHLNLRMFTGRYRPGGDCDLRHASRSGTGRLQVKPS